MSAIAALLALIRAARVRHAIDLLKLGYRCTERVPTARATHVVLTRQG